MNISDFVILPGSKTGTSVKLKAKYLRELQLEKVQLELQNKEMEKKLQLLQSNMSREKEERERSSGYRWQSGQVGPMGIQPQILLQNKENGVKVRNQYINIFVEPVKLPLKHKIANVVATENPKMKGKVCGQCETKNALLVCLECGEDYCGSCFAKIHQKGALKLHRMIPLQAKASASVGKLEVVHRFMKEVNPDESKMNHEQKKESSTNQLTSDTSSSPLTSTGSAVEFSTSSTWTGFENQDGRLLLHGTFDEDESSKSFQEALTQWRHGNHELKKKQNSIKAEAESMGICEVQTHLTLSREPVQIEFKEDSLTYMEKLWLKKHRSCFLLIFCLLFKLLQEVARREKPVSTQYQGLENFFSLGANSKQVTPESLPSLCSDSSPTDNISFSGNTEKKKHDLLFIFISATSFPRPLSANIPLCGMIKSRPIQSSRSQIRPKSSTGQLLSTVVAEISKFEVDDLTEQDDPLLEDMADQQALANLEKELQSHIDPQEKLCRLTSEDLSASSRHSKKISENITDFHNNLELKDHSRVDTLR
uniref:B box-type domain-containing protein n=1 Tax=Crocodylus porosus TaxID=8502 RepID=A0A7M4FWA1_CROPO